MKQPGKKTKRRDPTVSKISQHDKRAKEIALNYIKNGSGKYAAYRNKEKSGEDKPADSKKTLKRLMALSKPFIFAFTISCAAAIVYTVINAYAPGVLGDVVDAIQTQVQNRLHGVPLDFSEVKMLLIKTVALYVAAGLFQYVQQFVMAGVSQKMLCSMREQVNSKLARLPLSFYDSHTKGDLLSRLTNDISNLSNILQNSILTVITSVIQVAAVIIIMFFQNWKLALITVLISPLGAVFSYFVSRISRKWFKRYWNTTGDLNGHIEEMYTGHTINKTFNNEEKAKAEFDEINDGLQYITVKANFISGTIEPVINLINNAVYVIICIVSGNMIVAGAAGFSLGSITKFISYNSLLSSPLTSLSKLINSIQSGLASAERVFELLDEDEEVPDSDKVTTLNADGRVDFKNVSFRYREDKPLIEDFSMTANKGDLIAIVGPTGAGKTTIINLLMRFYDIRSGEIDVDGVNITDMPRELLRSQIGMVLQDTWIFKGSIRDNIAYGKENASDDEVIRAAKIARIHDFIMSQPDGYNTELKEDGTNISQGQKQLITIARAVLADPPILILDEATSSVDTKTELQIQKAMKYLMKDRTSFVIAHRLSTIKNADRILVMRKGSVVEAGTHEELMEAKGFYAMLHDCQYQGGIPPEDDE